ncbi:hypothetical protein MRX96_040367 [Rhipicephalus microplus]
MYTCAHPNGSPERGSGHCAAAATRPLQRCSTTTSNNSRARGLIRAAHLSACRPPASSLASPFPAGENDGAVVAAAGTRIACQRQRGCNKLPALLRQDLPRLRLLSLCAETKAQRASDLDATGAREDAAVRAGDTERDRDPG